MHFWVHMLMGTIAIMASGEDVILILESIFRGHHVYRYLVTNDGRDTRNEHKRRAVCVLKSGTIVGHAPREFSGTLWKNILWSDWKKKAQ